MLLLAHLNSDADAVDHVCLEALEDLARLDDRGEDRREALLGEHNVGRGLGSVGRTGDGDTNLGLGKGRRVVHAITSHTDHLALRLEDSDDLVLVLWHHLSEAVAVGDKIVARGARRPERGVRVDVDAEIDLASELLRDVEVVAGDHLHIDRREADLLDRLGRVGTRRVHDR